MLLSVRSSSIHVTLFVCADGNDSALLLSDVGVSGVSIKLRMVACWNNEGSVYEVIECLAVRFFSKIGVWLEVWGDVLC